MNKSVSLTYFPPTKDYRKVAQLAWGLTDEQMKGKHVHHQPPVSEGGRNVPEHLYVCSPSLHAYGWHSEAYFIERAAEAGRSNKGLRRSDTAKENNRNAQIGKNKGKNHWHNPKTGEEKFALACPDKGWVEGISNKRRERTLVANRKRSVPVVCTFADGSEVMFESATDAARYFSIDRGDICRCCKGKSKSAGGFKWRYDTTEG